MLLEILNYFLLQFFSSCKLTAFQPVTLSLEPSDGVANLSTLTGHYPHAMLFLFSGFILGIAILLLFLYLFQKFQPRKLSYEQMNLQLDESKSKMSRSLHTTQMLEEELAKSEARYREFVEDAGDMLFELNESGVFVYANPAVKKETGFEPQDLIGKRYWEFVLPEYKNKLRDFYLEQVLSGKTDSYYECPILTLTGDPCWIGQRVIIYYNGAGSRTTRVIARNITIQKQIQEALEISERRFRTLAEEAPVGIIQTDIDGKYVYVNEKWQEIGGISFEEGIGDGWIMAIPQPSRERVMDIWRNFVQTQENTKEPFRFPIINQKTFETRWVTATAVVLKNRKGEAIGFLKTVQDITQMKRDQDLIARSEANLNLLFENTNELIWSINDQLEITNCNEKFRDLYRKLYQKEIKTGYRMTFDVLPAQRQAEWRAWKHRAFQGEQFHSEVEFEVEGQLLHLQHDFYPVLENGVVKRVTVFSRNITGFRKAEKQMKKYSVGLKLLNDLGVDTVGTDERIRRALIRVSKFMNMQHGYISRFKNEDTLEIIEHIQDHKNVEAGQLFDLDKSYCGLVYYRRQPVMVNEMATSEFSGLEGYRLFGMEAYIGAPVWVNGKLFGTVSFLSKEAHSEAFTHYDQEFLLLLARWVGTELERKAYEDQLIEAKDKAEKASEVKMNFLSSMSHEIRTPLNAIIGMSRLLLDDSPNLGQRENLELIKFSGENLLNIINDILDLNKIDSGKIELENAPFDLRQLIQKSFKSLAYKAKEKGLDFHLTYDEKLPTTFIGDAHRLTQVFYNLLSNALKFTDEGHVSLVVKGIEQAEDHHRLFFEVKDSGIGIPSEKLNHIFEDYTQASRDTSRKYGGTGLGLPIVKKILQLMGSEVKVESKLGEGTTFSFEIELSESSPTVSNTFGEEQVVDLSVFEMNILLVEDNLANQLIAKKLLQNWGVQVQVAQNGEEALSLVETKTFDMVLMDIQLPGIDGYETTRRIRQQGHEYFRKLPVIALTASVLHEISGRALDAGMNDFVSKPFDPVVLNNKLLKYLTDSPLHIPEENELKAVSYKEEKTVLNAGTTIEEVLDAIARNDQQLKLELGDLYRLNLLHLRNEFAKATAEKDLEEMQRIAHKYQPTLIMLKLDSLLQLITEIRQQAKKLNYTSVHVQQRQFDEYCLQAISQLDEFCGNPSE